MPPEYPRSLCETTKFGACPDMRGALGSIHETLSVRLNLALLLTVIILYGLRAGTTPGPNVNMFRAQTGHRRWLLQRQNEPSIAVSTRNASHLWQAANDYRSRGLADFWESRSRECVVGSLNLRQRPDMEEYALPGYRWIVLLAGLCRNTRF